MKKNCKLQVVKKVEIDEDYVIIIAKKVKEVHTSCKDCEYLTQYNNKLRVGVCAKYMGIVSDDDICIEDGM